MREYRPPGSVRGAPGNRRPYLDRLTLQGGGSVNGSFLKAGLIDELRLLVVPIADGATATPTVFDVEPGYTKRKAAKLKLRSAKVVNRDFVMLEYTVS